MDKVAKAVVLEGIRKLAIREFPLPQIGPKDTLLKIERAGICGTDPKYYRGDRPQMLPIVMGHEIMGRVAAIGNEAAKNYDLKEGERVVVSGVVPCGQCPRCLSGKWRLCKSRIGSWNTTCTQPPHLWGGYAEYKYVPPGSIIHKISGDLPADAAMLVPNIANGIRWTCHLGGASVGQAVVIQGAGPQGLSCTVAARESGACQIIVTGLTADAERLAVAREFGAHHTINVEEKDVVAEVREITGGEMADLVVDVTGSPKALVASLELVRPQGTVMSCGVTGSRTVTPLLVDRISLREIRFQGGYSNSIESLRAATRLIESRKYPVEKMVTHKFSLDEADLALRVMGGEVEGCHPVKSCIIP